MGNGEDKMMTVSQECIKIQAVRHRMMIKRLEAQLEQLRAAVVFLEGICLHEVQKEKICEICGKVMR